MSNLLISICIPTYNRASILQKSLSNLIPQIIEYNYEIVISDNASTDNTLEVVEYFKLMYPNIKYFKNAYNEGADRNIANCILKSNGKYIWILGDNYSLNNTYFNEIVEKIKNDEFDALILNANDRVKKIKSKLYIDYIELFSDLGWHITLISTLIFKKEAIIEKEINKYYNTNFIHMGIFINYIIRKKNIKIFWYSNNVVFPTMHIDLKKTWHKNSLEIFGKSWVNFILSLSDSIPLEIKHYIIKVHGKNRNMYTIKYFIRIKYNFDNHIKDIIKYKKYLKYISDVPVLLIYLIFLLPKEIYHPIYFFKGKLKLFNEDA